MNMQFKQPRSAAEADQSAKLSIRGVTKSYGSIAVLKSLDLEVRDGELLTLLGPSGSGKTTLLQIICGLVEPSSGSVAIDGRDQTNLPVHERDIGVVFQHYALFPHLTVAENVAFPLRMRRLKQRDIQRRVDEALTMVNLSHVGDRLPKALSGGQQQRVALARCLVYRPGVILMDEPLGALDRKLRETMQMEIKRIHRETGATIVFVTHDQEEALALSDRICLMNEGSIAQIDTPHAIYDRPNSRFCAEFIGLSNIFEGALVEGGMRTADGLIPLYGLTQDYTYLMVRPENVEFIPAGTGYFDATIVESVYAGSNTQVVAQSAAGTTISCRCPAGVSALAVGSKVGVTWRADAVRYIK
ncbi:ABC transporter ATP-binding protein [Rhizobium calliandrae]|uniref:ABC transporter ATP-binding protein n=1 Tax=Rhizobium calliandrae TaxID=1312182 RepID=A0ABT7KLT7_9HYPH|nr:ABC transporter ATP-binding protein [Rhizobium calliandrae]MDL2409585.1 ABC transporter ATP-binding protein [Rhizobium calliandrae]